VTIDSGPGTPVAQKTDYFYDQTAVTPTAGTPQHVAASGPRGNLTEVDGKRLSNPRVADWA